MQPIDREKIEAEKRNEENTKKQYITPALKKVWNEDDIVMEYFTDGRIIPHDDGTYEREEGKRVDYLLLYQENIPLALVEAKAYNRSAEDGYSQAINYAKLLDVPFAYSSNGQCFIEKDMVTKANRTLGMEEFPSAVQLWERYKEETELSSEAEKIYLAEYQYSSASGRKPRYYQRIAINRVVKAIMEDKKRMLLVMATGTGKTYVAMQIMYRFWKTRQKKKILFLADRNILVDQPMKKDFSPFKDVMVKITDNKKIPTEYEIYLSLYHQLKLGEKNYYEQLPPDFFDMIIVDECHRSSATESRDDDGTGNWHDILEYFGSAVQIGLTATPKETEDTSNIKYFCSDTGEKPLYTYTLKQGIEDGFLAPYKVVSVELNVDRDGYRPAKGEKDVQGNDVEDRLYTQEEFDTRNGIIVQSRRIAVAKRITEFLKENGDRFSKTIVFCETREHAGAMRRLLENENQDIVAEHPDYVTRIVSDDDEGNALLEDFTTPSCKFPVIATTSQLLSTGVDTKTVELIVLDKTVHSMTEFKQIIGRGSRIEQEYEIDNTPRSKTNFAILDFRKNYLKFRDAEFDGEPVCIYSVGEDDDFSKTKSKKKGKKNPSYIPTVTGTNVEITGEVTRHLDENIQLVQENLESCVKNNIRTQYPAPEEFMDEWLKSDNKTKLADELLIDIAYPNKVIESFGYSIDKYDIILYAGYQINPMSKAERAKKVDDYVSGLPEKQQEIMTILFKCYQHSDFDELKEMRIFDLPIFTKAGWTRLSAIQQFGSKEKYLNFMSVIEKKLYE